MVKWNDITERELKEEELSSKIENLVRENFEIKGNKIKREGLMIGVKDSSEKNPKLILTMVSGFPEIYLFHRAYKREMITFSEGYEKLIGEEVTVVENYLEFDKLPTK